MRNKKRCQELSIKIQNQEKERFLKNLRRYYNSIGC